jgi:hypothetical protein
MAHALAQTAAMHRTAPCVGRAPVKGLRLGAAKRAPARTSLVCKVRPSPVRATEERCGLRGAMANLVGTRVCTHGSIAVPPLPLGARCCAHRLLGGYNADDRRSEKAALATGRAVLIWERRGPRIPSRASLHVGSTWPSTRELQWRRAAAWRDGILHYVAHVYRIVARCWETPATRARSRAWVVGLVAAGYRG